MKKATVSETNGKLSFNVVLHEQREDDGNDISFFYVSVNDDGPYSPYCVVEQNGRLYLYNVGDEILEPKTWRDLLMLVSEDTAKSREAVSAVASQ